MAGISVIFRAVDEISSRFDAMVSAGTRALENFDRLEAAADSSYAVVSEGAAEAAEAIDRAAVSADLLHDAVSGNAMEETGAVFADAAQGMEELGEKSDRARDAFGRFLPKNKEVKDSIEKTRKEQEKYRDETGRTADAIESLSNVIATVGIVSMLVGMAGAFTQCSEAAAGFETNVAMVSTVADAAALSTDELSAQISDLSIDTAKNVNELADASYNAISAGVATEDAVATVGDATKLATAGFTSSSSALSVLTTTLNAYGLEASEVTNISDSLITSQNLGVLTIDQMANSMGKAISTASAYSVDLYNLEAGYISLTKAGISVEESTTYISSMFNELGSAGSAVATVITEETGMSFGQLMNAGYSLADVLDIVYESAGRDGEAMMNLWGSAEAGKAANAIINQGLETFNSNLEKLENSAGTTQAAYEAMTNTTAYSTERMENSFNNLSIAIGDDLNPVVSRFQNGIADVTDGFTKLINENPAITAALTGIVVGIGAVTLAITAYIAVTKIAAVASAALGATMTAALGPIMLVATAVAAVTSAVVYAEGEAEKAQESLTASSQEQYEELQELNSEYERACEVYGKTHEEALRLKYQVDELSESFEENKQTMEEFLAECDSVIESCQQMADEYRENMEILDSNETGTMALIQRLDDLANSTDNTAGKQMQMEAIIAELNGTVDGLNLSYGDLINSQEAAMSSLREYAEAQAQQERMQAQYDAYVQSISKEAEAQEELIAVKKELTAAQEAYNTAEQEFGDNLLKVALSGDAGFTGIGAALGPYGRALDAAKENVEALEATEAELTAALEEQQNIQTECETAWEKLANATAEATAASDGYAEAKEVLAEYSEQIQQLCEDYDAAYQSALDSIQGQYSLWDEAGEVASMSSQNIRDALQSQVDYWNAYNENMAGLTERAGEIEGLSDMLADLADGSEESAAMLAGMENMNDADLSAIVQQYNDLQAAQSETAASVADLETEFSEELENMQTEMDDMVEGMDMSAEAKANAKATMDAYVSEIQSGVERAQSAIDSLNFATNTLSGGGYHEYAAGTIDAEPGLALVGEEGPELVNFRGGEVVYTAPETADILSRSEGGSDFYVAPPEADEEKESSGDKTVTLRIEGAGEMKVGGNGVSKDEVVGVLMDNIKEVLMKILQTEILEEGDLAYEF